MFALLFPGCIERSSPAPNLLILVADTLRADGLGRYGDTDADTPVLDGLARDGMLFERAYAVSAWTPSDELKSGAPVSSSMMSPSRE